MLARRVRSPEPRRARPPRPLGGDAFAFSRCRIRSRRAAMLVRRVRSSEPCQARPLCPLAGDASTCPRCRVRSSEQPCSSATCARRRRLRLPALSCPLVVAVPSSPAMFACRRRVCSPKTRPPARAAASVRPPAAGRRPPRSITRSHAGYPLPRALAVCLSATCLLLLVGPGRTKEVEERVREREQANIYYDSTLLLWRGVSIDNFVLTWYHEKCA